MRRVLVLACALCLISARASADAGCGVIVGTDWALTFSTPARWVSQCRPEKNGGAAVALWPQGTTPADAPAGISVTVNSKNSRSLPVFAADEQQRFRSDKPNITVRFEPAMSGGDGAHKVVFRATDTRNHHLIAYVEGPTRFFVVEMSARNTNSLDEYQGAFKELLDSIVPMKVR